MSVSPAEIDRVAGAVNRDRLLQTAQRLCAVYSPTGQAGAVADLLAQILAEDGFDVERPVAGFPPAPAVAVRYGPGATGRTLQLNGHLDTVHLPFVPPAVEGDRLTGTGSADMKAGVAAAVEALRALADTGLLTRGGVLFTAHDTHEAPWGNGQQVCGLIDEGFVGDAVLIPEYMVDVLPVVGRGHAVLKIAVRRPGPPVHEVFRPLDEPHPIAAAAALVTRLFAYNDELGRKSHPVAGPESLFIGQIHGGEIFNQFPHECRLEGTRRWLPGHDRRDVERGFCELISAVATETGATIDAEFQLVRDAYRLDTTDPVVGAFQRCVAHFGAGPLPEGGKPFVDDGNTFWARAGVAAITHGPLAGGAHTTDEWVSIDDLVRVARVYAATALDYCQGE